MQGAGWLVPPTFRPPQTKVVEHLKSPVREGCGQRAVSSGSALKARRMVPLQPWTEGLCPPRFSGPVTLPGEAGLSWSQAGTGDQAGKPGVAAAWLPTPDPPPEHAAGSGVPKGLPEERGRHRSREAAEAPAGEHTAGGEATPPPPPPQPAPCSPGGRAAAPRPLAKGCPRAAGGQRPGRRPVPCSPPPESGLHVAQTRAVLGRFYDT